MIRVTSLGGRAVRGPAAFSPFSSAVAVALERRVLLSAFTVTSTSDSGPGSLRQAIVDANASPGADTIAFKIPGAGVKTVVPASALPAVTGPLTLDGTTQPGRPTGSSAPMIELNGSGAGAMANGLSLSPGASGSKIMSLTINRFARDGIFMQASGCEITGCYIGTTATGAAAAANRGNGITVSGGGNDTIGSITAPDRNLISGNAMVGLALYASGCVVYGNYIGTDAAGAAAVGNGHEGILIAAGAKIGGLCDTRNIISGNASSGILVSSAAEVNIVNNYIGTDVTGTKAIGNGSSPAAPWRDGVTVFGTNANIGATDSGQWQGNLISGNAAAGIFVGGNYNSSSHINIVRNYIGTDSTGNVALGNGGDGILVTGNAPTIGGSNQFLGNRTNVISGNALDGILVQGYGAFAAIQSNFIGTNARGTARVANHANGIEVLNASAMIGGKDADASNIISGNEGDGVFLTTTSVNQNQHPGGSRVQGNSIGLNAKGNPLGNSGDGVDIAGDSGDIIGSLSDETAGGNAISANGGSGISVSNPLGVSTFGGNQIYANVIGTDRHANVAPGFGNGRDGVCIAGAHNTKIGGAGVGNTIAGNIGNGVTIVASLLFGQRADQNTISQNSIFQNGGLGIDLGNDGVTPNHATSDSNAPNRWGPFPVILSAVSYPTYTLVHYSGTGKIEFFSNASADPSGYGEGGAFLAAKAVLPPLPVGTVLTATATDDLGDTSEFSKAVATTAPPAVTSATYDASSNTVTVAFSKDVSAGLPVNALLVRNQTTGEQFDPIGVSFDRSSNVATFVLPGTLTSGSYSASVLASLLRDSIGAHPASNYPLSFSYLVGDVDGSGLVDLGDVLILSGSYGHAGTFAQGDVNHDGKVDLDDLLILAQNFGRHVY